MSEPAIRVDGLVVEVGRARILGPLDLEVAAGEHVLLVGPSGSGKTTLLRAIAGLARPTAGRIELFGEPASDGRTLATPPARRGVGLVFQGGALWPHMSVRRTLRFVMRARGVPAAEWDARAARALELVDLVGFDARKPATLSGGERQRLALAREIVGQPRILLLDEPLGPLDADRRAALLERLDLLQRELELTLVHVTHDPDEAERVAGRRIAIEAGRIVAAAGVER